MNGISYDAQRYVLPAVDTRAVVADDHHHRVVGIRPAGERFHEAPDRVVGVAHACFPAAAARGHARDARRERERLVVRGRHHNREDALAASVLRVEDGERVAEQVLVADAPDVAEPRRVHLCAVDHPVAVVAEEIVHVVERPVTAVDERRRVAARGHDGGPVEHALVAGALDDRLGRDRGERRGHGFHAPHGAGAGGVAAREDQAFVGDAIEIRRQPALVAVGPDELRAQRLLQQHDHVERQRAAGIRDATGERIGAARQERRVGLRDEPARALGGFPAVEGKVVLEIVKVARERRAEERADTVRGELGSHPVLPGHPCGREPQSRGGQQERRHRGRDSLTHAALLGQRVAKRAAEGP